MARTWSAIDARAQETYFADRDREVKRFAIRHVRRDVSVQCSRARMFGRSIHRRQYPWRGVREALRQRSPVSATERASFNSRAVCRMLQSFIERLRHFIDIPRRKPASRSVPCQPRWPNRPHRSSSPPALRPTHSAEPGGDQQAPSEGSPEGTPRTFGKRLVCSLKNPLCPI